MAYGIICANQTAAQHCPAGQVELATNTSLYRTYYYGSAQETCRNTSEESILRRSLRAIF